MQSFKKTFLSFFVETFDEYICADILTNPKHTENFACFEKLLHFT